METAEKLLEDGTSGMTNKTALASNGTSDAKIFLKMLGFPAFSKTLAYSVQCQLNAIWYYPFLPTLYPHAASLLLTFRSPWPSSSTSLLAIIGSRTSHHLTPFLW